MQTMNIKGVWLICCVTFLGACSHYPTSGGIDLKEFESYKRGEEVVAKNAIGLVIEIDEGMLEAMKKIKKHSLELKALIDEPDHDINLSGNFITDEVRAAVQAYRSWDDGLEVKISDDVKNWLEEVNYIENDLQTGLREMERKDAQYLEFISGAKTKLETLKSEEQTLQDDKNRILSAIVDEANKIIVEKKLPLKKLNTNSFSLYSESLNWRKAKNTSEVSCDNQRGGGLLAKRYTSEQYILLSQKPIKNKCVYISRPIKNYHAADFEQFVVNKYHEYEKVDDQHKANIEAINVAEKDLKDAHIIAFNQTNIDYDKNKKQMNEFKQLMDGIKGLNNDGGLASRYFNKGTINNEVANQILSIQRILSSYLKHEKQAHRLDSLRQTYKALMSIDYMYVWGRRSKHENSYRDFINTHINNLKDQALEQHLVKKTKVNEDCTFGGLDGKAGYVVLVLRCTIDGQDGAIKAFFDMTDEKNSFAEKEAIWLNEDNTESLNPRYVKKDNLENFFPKTIEKGFRNKLEKTEMAL